MAQRSLSKTRGQLCSRLSLIDPDIVLWGLQVLQKARGVEDVDIELEDITEAARQSRLIKNPYLTIIKRKYRPQFIIALIFMIFQQFDVSPPHLKTFWTDTLWRLKLACSACSLSVRSGSVARENCKCEVYVALIHRCLASVSICGSSELLWLLRNHVNLHHQH